MYLYIWRYRHYAFSKTMGFGIFPSGLLQLPGDRSGLLKVMPCSWWSSAGLMSQNLPGKPYDDDEDDDDDDDDDDCYHYLLLLLFNMLLHIVTPFLKAAYIYLPTTSDHPFT